MDSICVSLSEKTIQVLILNAIRWLFRRKYFKRIRFVIFFCLLSLLIKNSKTRQLRTQNTHASVTAAAWVKAWFSTIPCSDNNILYLLQKYWWERKKFRKAFDILGTCVTNSKTNLSNTCAVQLVWFVIIKMLLEISCSSPSIYMHVCVCQRHWAE